MPAQPGIMRRQKCGRRKRATVFVTKSAHTAHLAEVTASFTTSSIAQKDAVTVLTCIQRCQCTGTATKWCHVWTLNRLCMQCLHCHNTCTNGNLTGSLALHTIASACRNNVVVYGGVWSSCATNVVASFFSATELCCVAESKVKTICWVRVLNEEWHFLRRTSGA